MRHMGFPRGSDGKESACNSGEPGFNPWIGKIPWRREWQPTLIFLPGESHGQRSLSGCSPWGRKGLDTAEVTEHARSLLRQHTGHSLCTQMGVRNLQQVRNMLKDLVERNSILGFALKKKKPQQYCCLKGSVHWEIII